MANLIQDLGRPTLIISHNKTLAAQLYGEFKSFFPDNRVEYFVSYYDYYQPEAYVAASDTYIEKDASPSTTSWTACACPPPHALLESKDVVVISSVHHCIYGLGDPDVYRDMFLALEKGQTVTRDSLLRKLVQMQYGRSQVDFVRGQFRVRGDRLEIFPAYGETVIGFDFFGDEIEKISEHRDPLTEAVARFGQLRALSCQNLRHAPGRHAAGHRQHQGRAEGAPGRAEVRGQAAGSPAPGPAHPL